MGMFDSVIIYCPNCGTQIEFQSKAGDCNLRSYTLSDIPSTIAADLIGDCASCSKCKRLIRIQGSVVCYPILEGIDESDTE